ncbi:MAG: FAD-binding protein, partial [Thermoguttaceae bacterium]|nr:FAD-binding protein [Thermoguttaceae bacterium]
MIIKTFHTVVLGSGASGLAAAVRLNAEGVENVAVVTEGLKMGTSINTGSDKQTYYKLGVCGASPDSPRALAESYVAGGAADGDLALVEAATSIRAFFHLVDLGAPFPRDAYGQYAGYKTDHDPAKRATSCGPYASREMCRALIRDLKRRDVAVFENRLAVRLLAVASGDETPTDAPARKKIVGLIAIDETTGEPEIYRAENVVFAVGGPGGLYKTSVYPEVHVGAVGLALEIGALAASLPESQFGLASFTDVSKRVENKDFGDVAPIKEFRWNVSGTFMQVVPKFISTDADGGEPREFLRRYFDDPADLFGRVFLKGYQWPFDARKALGGSSF